MANPRPDLRDPLAGGSNAVRPAVDQAIDESMPLFAPIRGEPTTSQLAHEQASRKFTQKQQQIIDLLNEHGAMTQGQIAQRLGVPHHTISGRFGDLERLGRIEKTGERVPNAAGILCNVYRVKRLEFDAR
jgi:predicted HTH transcriptional regulator